MRPVLDLDHATIPYFARCQWNGVPIDRPGCAALADRMADRYAEVVEEIQRHLGYYINPNSDQQVREVLKALLPAEEIADIKLTDSGEISTSKKVLEHLRGLNPGVDLVTHARALKKIETSFARPLATEIDPPPPAEPNRARSNLRLTRVASGRVAASKREEGGASLLTLPKRSDLGLEVRKQVRVQVPGRKLFSADESQIEFRTCAHRSRDETLIGIFERGEDMHVRTASQIFDIRPELLDKRKHRIPAKNAGFGILFGITAKGLLDQMRLNGEGAHWDEESCQKLLDEWFKVFPGVKAYISMARARVMHYGYAETMSGRRRYLPGAQSDLSWIREEAWRQAVSLEIQGDAQDVLKTAMAELWPVLVAHWRTPGAGYVEPLLQVHDELLFEADEAELDWLMPTVEAALTLTTPLCVPLLSSASIGDDWGSMEK